MAMHQYADNGESVLPLDKIICGDAAEMTAASSRFRRRFIRPTAFALLVEPLEQKKAAIRTIQFFRDATSNGSGNHSSSI